MGSLRKAAGPLKVPRLRMKDELLKSAPELAKLLGEEVEDPDKDFVTDRLNTPQGHEEAISESEELSKELAAVKKDRSEIIHALAHIKTNLVGSGGGEAQTQQVLQLQKELELKKLTLNELRTDSKKLTKQIADTKTQIHDAVLLTPGGYENEVATIKQLMSDCARLDEDLIEAEAKNRLYTLLAERTRNDHLDMERKVRDARDAKTAAAEDHAALTQHMNDMRAAKEDAEKQLSRTRRLLDDAKKDWQRKLKDRKKEVQALKRRQEREELRELKRKEKQEEDDRREAERLRKVALEQAAHEAQLQELAPKLEAMETSWNRLRTITGADAPEEVIAFWEGLKSKEEHMQQLVAAAEAQEASIKARIEDLLQRRNELLEQDATALDASTTSEASGTQGAEVSSADAEARIAEAHRKAEVTRKKFEKLRTICISAEQGLRSLRDRARLALQEVTPAELAPVIKLPQGTPPRPGRKNERRESMAKRVFNSRESKRFSDSRKAAEATAAQSKDNLADSGDVQVLAPASGHNTIDDDTFFDKLPALVAETGDKLAKLLQLEAESLASLTELEETGDVAAGPAAAERDDDDEFVDGEDDAAGAEDAAAGAAGAGEADSGAVGDSSGLMLSAQGGDTAEVGVTGATEYEDATSAGATALVGASGATEYLDADSGSAEATGGVASPRGSEARIADENATSGAAPAAAADAEVTAQTDAAVPNAQAANELSPAAHSALEREPTDEELEHSEAAHVLRARDNVPTQEKTLLDTLLSDEAAGSAADIEQRITRMNKGMKKLDWSGAPLVAGVNPASKDILPPLSTLTKKVKGRRRAADKAAPLERILGYTDDAGESDDDEDVAGGDDDDDGDGVVERETIKRMAAKMEARAAKARADAAAAGQQ